MMIRRATIAAALCAGAVLTAPAAEAACPKPRSLTVKQVAPAAVEVGWKAPRTGAKGLRYRVLRGKVVVGQTRGRKMRVNLRPGRTTKLAVGIIGRGARRPSCYASRKASIAKPGPNAVTLAAPQGLYASAPANGTTTANWQPVAGAAGYRIYRDGGVVGQTTATSRQVKVWSTQRGHEIAVAAVARGGVEGARSAPITVRVGHRAPGAPSGLAVSDVTTTSFTVTWRPGTAGSAPIQGYRVMRNGVVLRQTSATQLRVGNLRPLSRYGVSVVTVDTLGVASDPVSVDADTAAPEPTTGSAHAFLLASTDQSFEAFKQHYRQIGTVYPTYFDCSRTDPAQIAGRDDARVSSYVRERKIELMPRFNCQRPATLQAILYNDVTRKAVIDGLVALADRYDYDGINLDLEAGAPSDRAALTAFVAEIAGDLHRSGRHLSIDVSPKTRDLPNHPRSTFFDYAALSQSADYVLVMGWGLTWTTSAPGPQSNRQWLTAVANYVATMPNKSRFVLGTSLYGMDWPLGGGPAHPATALQYADVQALAARVGATPVRDPASGELNFSYTDADGRPHDVWYRDAQTVDFGFQLARRLGLGISLWRLGREDPAIWQNPALAG